MKLLSLPLLVGIVAAFIFPGAAHAQYSSGQLINDTLFLNASSMTQASIQAFLTNMGSGLASQSFLFDCASTGTQSSQAYQAAGAPCGQTVQASSIIYYAAQIYGVNPQVILATLQKEQSLITTPNPTSWQIDQAMGYGCPDSGGCSASNFLYQIDNGVWVLRYHFERARGNMTYWFTSTSWVCGTAKNYYKPSLYPGQNVSFYDDSNVLYTTLWLSNAATSSLYCYTPHAYNNPQGLYGLPVVGTTGQYYSGSYNFVKYFEKWFGSTNNNSPFFAINNHLYILGANSTYYNVPSQALADAYGINSIFGGYVNYTDSTFLSNMTDIGNLPWIARFNDVDIYAVTPQGLHHFATESDYTNFGYQFGDEAILPAYLKSFYPVSSDITPLVMLTDWSAIYNVQGGSKSQIATLSAYETLGTPVYSSRKSVVLPPAYVATLPDSAPIVLDGTFTKTTDTNQLGVYSNGQLYALDPGTAGYWGISPDYLTTSSRLNMLNQAGVTLNSQLVSDSYGNKYLLDQARKITFSSTQSTAYGLDSKTYTTVNQDILSRFVPQSAAPLVRSLNDPSVYLPLDGVLYHVYSPTDLQGLGYSQQNVMVLNAPVGSLFTNSGNYAFAPGRLIRVNGTLQVYAVDDNRTLHHVPSEDIFYAFNYSFNNVTVVPTGGLNGYPTGTELGSYVSEASGTTWIIDRGIRYRIDASLLPDFGYSTNQFTVVSSRIIYPTSLGPNMTNLIRANNALNVYYVSGGQRHWVPTESLFYAKGFTWSQVRVLSPGIVNAIPQGSDLQ